MVASEASGYALASIAGSDAGTEAEVPLRTSAADDKHRGTWVQNLLWQMCWLQGTVLLLSLTPLSPITWAAGDDGLQPRACGPIVGLRAYARHRSWHEYAKQQEWTLDNIYSTSNQKWALERCGYQTGKVTAACTQGAWLLCLDLPVPACSSAGLSADCL